MNFSGKWRLNPAKSRGIGAQMILATIDHDEPRVSQSMLVTTAAGEERVTYVFRTDGEESVNLVRGTEARTRAHWEGEELIVESSMKTPARDFRFRDCWSIAPDGTLVMEHRDDDLAGQCAVLDRV